jgi:predicted RNase H-like HicB family nuclease
MLISYIQTAMRHAEFERMEDGRYFGTIGECPGLWADGDSVETCRTELQSVLEDWLILKFRFGHPIPVIDGIDLNPEPAYAQAD